MDFSGIEEQKNRELQGAHHQQNLEQEARLKTTELRSQIINEGGKGLVLINGGTAVALGALFQAVIEKPLADTLLPFILRGIGFVAAGVMCASLIFLARYFSTYDSNSL